MLLDCYFMERLEVFFNTTMMSDRYVRVCVRVYNIGPIKLLKWEDNVLYLRGRFRDTDSLSFPALSAYNSLIYLPQQHCTVLCKPVCHLDISVMFLVIFGLQI